MWFAPWLARLRGAVVARFGSVFVGGRRRSFLRGGRVGVGYCKFSGEVCGGSVRSVGGQIWLGWREQGGRDGGR